MFVHREGIGAAFGTSLVWLMGPKGLGVQALLRLLGMCRCPARSLARADGAARVCSRQAGPWQPARGLFSWEKNTSCDRAKQEIVLSTQITALCAGTALRNGWGDTDGVNHCLKAQLPEGGRSLLQRWCGDGGIWDSPWVKPAHIPPAPWGHSEGLNG